MKRVLDREPTLIKFWDRAYTPKESSMSPAALAIGEQFQRLYDQRIFELEAARRDLEPLDSTIPPLEIRLSQDKEMALWIAAQDPPSIYFFWSSTQRQRLTAPVRPSHTGTGLPDELFQRVMTAVQERFSIDLVFRQQTLPSRQRLHQLAQDIAAGATTGSTGIPQEQFIAISDKIVRMVATYCWIRLGHC